MTEEAIYAADLDVANDSKLKRVSALAQQQANLEAALAATNESAKALGEQLRTVREIDLPAAMDEAGLSKFTTSSGLQVSVSERFSCGNLKTAVGLDWLRAHDGADLIKREVEVTFSRGEDADAAALAAELAKRYRGHDIKDYSQVVWNTLSSWVKERVEAGEEVDFEALGVALLRQAKIKLPK